MKAIETKPVRIWVTDLHTRAHEPFLYLHQALPPYVLDSKTPELVIYEPFGTDHLNFDCTRIFITGENVRPDFNRTDYAIGFDHMEFGDRHLRVPLWVHYTAARERLQARQPVTAADLTNREFCLTVVSNGRRAAAQRDQFFMALDARRHVASMGRHLRNDQRLAEAEAAGQQNAKLMLADKFLFCLAFENSSAPGYVTEKILEAFALRAIPIYWGDPLVARDFNPAAFVNRMDFADDAACIDYVLELANDPERMMAILNAPIYAEPGLPEKYEQQMRDFMAEIFARPPDQRGRRDHFGWIKPQIDHENRKKKGLRAMLRNYFKRKKK